MSGTMSTKEYMNCLRKDLDVDESDYFSSNIELILSLDPSVDVYKFEVEKQKEVGSSALVKFEHHLGK